MQSKQFGTSTNGCGSLNSKKKMWSAIIQKPTKRRLLLTHQPKSKIAPLRPKVELLLLLLFNLFSESMQSKEKRLRWVSILIQNLLQSFYLIDTNFQCRHHATTSAVIPASLAIFPMSFQTALHRRQWCLVQVSQMRYQNIRIGENIIPTCTFHVVSHWTCTISRPWLSLCHPRLGQL